MEISLTVTVPDLLELKARGIITEAEIRYVLNLSAKTAENTIITEPVDLKPSNFLRSIWGKTDE